MSWLTNFIRPKIRFFANKRDIPENLWEHCPHCAKMMYRKDLEADLFVCGLCQHHLRWPVLMRLTHLFDEGKYELLPTPAVPVDPLHFRDQKRYSERLKEAQNRTHMADALVVASGKLGGRPLVVACFNFEFIGGSMGMAVGAAFINGAHEAVRQKCPYLTISASGGARMQEGVWALMQMPRTILATVLVKEAGLPFISLMTNPTTGGVAASFASLGDVILAEPGAIIGFTGPRVLQSTLRQSLPEGFQTSEFQKDHGFVDLILPRKELRETLGHILDILQKTPHHSYCPGVKAR